MMRFFDLHCDTLYKSLKDDVNLVDNKIHVSIDRALKYKPFFGCFAIWIPDEIRGDDALNLFYSCVDRLKSHHSMYNKYFEICRKKSDFEKILKNKYKSGIILTVEGGAVLAGNINNLSKLQECGVKMMTLTWNGQNELGDGAYVKNSSGISDFGKNVVKEMEKCGIIIDVSHSSEKMFYDVCDIVNCPIVASHSNSKSVCPHVRNLTDEQFRIISERKGIVGITFCKEFLSCKTNVDFDDIQRHIYHFWELDGEDIVCFGSDFDGADVPECVNGIEYVENLYEYLLKKNYSENLLDKLFFKNAYGFISKNCLS